MGSCREVFSCLALLTLLIHVRGQRDFDLADALDDPEPTKKPSSGIYPKPMPPYRPQPGNPDNSGNIYPRPRPPSRPQPGNFDNSGAGRIIQMSQWRLPTEPGEASLSGFVSDIDHHGGNYPPRPRPPAGGGGGYHPNYDGDGNTHGGDGYSSYGNAQGNTVAKIVSPIVSIVVVTLVGAAVRYFASNRRRNCFSSNEPQDV